MCYLHAECSPLLCITFQGYGLVSNLKYVYLYIVCFQMAVTVTTKKARKVARSRTRKIGNFFLDNANSEGASPGCWKGGQKAIGLGLEARAK